jgi:hypothetical protein
MDNNQFDSFHVMDTIPCKCGGAIPTRRHGKYFAGVRRNENGYAKAIYFECPQCGTTVSQVVGFNNLNYD